MNLSEPEACVQSALPALTLRQHYTRPLKLHIRQMKLHIRQMKTSNSPNETSNSPTLFGQMKIIYCLSLIFKELRGPIQLLFLHSCCYSFYLQVVHVVIYRPTYTVDHSCRPTLYTLSQKLPMLR